MEKEKKKGLVLWLCLGGAALLITLCFVFRFFVPLWILGGLLALILIPVLLVLSVPLRYRFTADKTKESFNLKGNASWLLHILHVDYSLADGSFDWGIRLFGFRLKKDKKESAAPPAEEKPAEKPEEKPAEEKKPLGAAEAKELWDESTERVEKAEKQLGRRKFSLEELEEKAQRLADRINYWYELARDNKEGVGRTFRYTGRLLGKILPRCAMLSLEYGASDPALTGQLAGLWSVLAIMIRKRPKRDLALYPDFDTQRFALDGSARGRFSLGSLGATFLRALLDKRVRKMIKTIKEVRARSGAAEPAPEAPEQKEE